MTGERPELAHRPESPLPAEGGMLWWRQSFNLTAEAVLWIGAPELGWQAIGGRVLGAAGINDGDDETIKGTYVETLNQAFSGMAQAFSGRLRKEVLAKDGVELDAQPAGADLDVIELQFPGAPALPLAIGFSAMLVESLVPAPAESAPPPRVAVQGGSAPAAEKSKNFDLLLEVELPVSVSFGRAQLPLKDVIKLTTGSIVELNRAITEPVEVIVNNCVIARGEVVVIEGNFGVRIQQVISRQERLRTLN